MVRLSNDARLLDRVVADEHQRIAPELSREAFFEIFVINQLFLDYDLTYEEIESGIISGAGDGGIDGLYTFVNGALLTTELEIGQLRKDLNFELVVVQCKTSPSFGEDAIDKFAVVIEALFEDLESDLDELSSVYNQELLEIAGLFRSTYLELARLRPQLTIRFFYATRGSDVDPKVERKVERLRIVVNRIFHRAGFEFHFLGARELRDLVARTKPRALELRPSTFFSTQDNAFVALVSLPAFREFLTDAHGALHSGIFDSNVRDYEGSVAVNRGIQRTLDDQADDCDFWWLNNGVTMVVADAVYRGGGLALEAPQIVNGLQTSLEIYNYFTRLPEVALRDERQVLIRILTPGSPGIRDRIIQATNNQTIIPREHLRATDRIQRNIEEHLLSSGYYYDRRRNFHKNAGRPKARILSMAAMAHAINAMLLQRPGLHTDRPARLLRDDTVYQKVFDEKYPLDLYLNAAMLRDQVLSLGRKELAGDPHLYPFIMAVTAVFVTNEVRPSVQSLAQPALFPVNRDLLSDASRQVIIGAKRVSSSERKTKRKRKTLVIDVKRHNWQRLEALINRELPNWLLSRRS
jgi:AIPR protein